MTSKEKLEALNCAWFCEPVYKEEENKREAIIKELEKDLEILDILKEFLSDGDTGTGWVEININPNNDKLDSKEHKKKQLLIKEWLNS